ncbi:hypothetical protein N431DRAFT_434534 [Stipitochalara longipes BDJ]|nr:hypothetical protein N431DRAFT_434534 [Stipitochalara longipes BDJ]
MADYSKEKVPDLKKLLQERGLVISGNKADLIARLQEDDSKKAGGAATAGEDEIDWDEDDKAAPEPTTAQVAAPAPAAPVEPSTLPAEAPPTTTTEAEPTAEAAPEEPKPDFSIGLKQSDALTEAEKRAARAKRFGIPQNEEAAKLAERAKKFGLESKDAVVKGLDSALPERKAKRGREGREGGEERASKRQTPDRRVEGGGKRAGRVKGKVEGAKGKEEEGRKGRIADDPVEKAKMEARAKKFGKPVPT